MEPKNVTHYCMPIVPVDILLQRIKQRGRKGEDSITREYLLELEDRYKEFY